MTIALLYKLLCMRGGVALQHRLVRVVSRVDVSKYLYIIACFVLLISAGWAGDGIWKESTFEDFADGRFGDGGANLYVSRQGRIQTVNRWDFNADGYLDLAFANSHPHSEKLDASIYWGNGTDFDISRSSYLPTQGSQFLIPADVNGDSHTDVLVPNYHDGTHDRMDSFIYLHGGLSSPEASDGWGFYPFSQKVSLPGQAARHAAAGDLNRDGYIDVVFAFSGGYWEYRADPLNPYESPSRIYWGSARGFSREQFSDIPTSAASAVAIADLNEDGWPDLVLARLLLTGVIGERSEEFKVTEEVDSHLYWGGPDGFSAKRRVGFPTLGAQMVKSADLNKDGFLDLVFANSVGKRSYIYYGSSAGFSAQKREELETLDARDCAIADVNRDGYPDILFSSHQNAGNPFTESYLYFGSRQGFSRDGRVEFETVGAWGVVLDDLNQDGWIDAVISNFQDYASYDIPSYIYWNTPSGFHPLRRTALLTHGAVGASVADLNEDGHLDLIFANTTGRYRGNHHPVSVYWGNPRGEYTVEHRQLLPAQDAYELAAADLNDDGYPELIVANTGETGRRQQESYIYWGSEKGFSSWRRSGLMGIRTLGISVADLDRDGYLDVILANRQSLGDEGGSSFIYWGSSEGFAATHRTSVPTDGAVAPLVADLNADGHLDLVFSSRRGGRGPVIYRGDGSRDYHPSRRDFVPGLSGSGPVKAADLNRDGHLDLLLPVGSYVYVYWGNGSGDYQKKGRMEIATTGSVAVTVADFNRDGWLDLVVPVYSTGTQRSSLTPVFWGHSEGYSEKRVTRLPSHGGTGSLAADFNRDGFLDLLIVCHRSDGDPNKIGRFGDHITPSFIYWGSAGGFDQGRLEIPTEGAHYDYGVDLGNHFDRTFQFDYVSSPYHFASGAPARIEWKGKTPFGSRLAFQIRAADSPEALEKASWMRPRGINTFYEYPGSRLEPINGAWVQYRARFVSPDGVNYPVLDEVSVHFEE